MWEYLCQPSPEIAVAIEKAIFAWFDRAPKLIFKPNLPIKVPSFKDLTSAIWTLAWHFAGFDQVIESHSIPPLSLTEMDACLRLRQSSYWTFLGMDHLERKAQFSNSHRNRGNYCRRFHNEAVSNSVEKLLITPRNCWDNKFTCIKTKAGIAGIALKKEKE